MTILTWVGQAPSESPAAMTKGRRLVPADEDGFATDVDEGAPATISERVWEAARVDLRTGAMFDGFETAAAQRGRAAGGASWGRVTTMARVCEPR